MKRRTVVLASVLTALLALGCEDDVSQPEGNSAESPIMTHPSQGVVVPVADARAELTTSASGANATFHTTNLVRGHAYTLWWIVINDPDACESSPCTEEDLILRRAAIQGDITYAAGGVPALDGTASLSSQISAGQLQYSWFDVGFTRPEAAEIHLVLRDHGPVIAELLDDQTRTYRGGCTDESVPNVLPPAVQADGQPGPFDCREVQFATFQP